MDKYFEEFLSSRIEAISGELLAGSGGYALACEKAKSLCEDVESITHCGDAITLGAGDCEMLRDFLESGFTMGAIRETELYRRGYLDCVKLLRCLGVLA